MLIVDVWHPALDGRAREESLASSDELLQQYRASQALHARLAAARPAATPAATRDSHAHDSHAHSS